MNSLPSKNLQKLLVVLSFYLCNFVYAAGVPVFVTTLKQQDFAENIEALGSLRANEAVTLSATVTDTVRAIHFDDGQRVKANTVLIEMTDDEEHALLKEAQTEVDEAQQQYERVKSLIKSKLTTESLVDQRRQAYDSARARLLATQSRLADRLIIAPFDGVVGLREISVGTLVRPGDTITTLDDDSQMKLDISIPALLLSSVKPGLKIEAKSSELKGQVFEGEVSSIDSRIDTSTRSIMVRAILPNPDHSLRPGMLMTVNIKASQRKELLIPEEAIVMEGFRKFVYRIDQGDSGPIASKTEVQTGSRAEGMVVVTQGLEPGQQVVTHGIMRLKNGAPVTIKAEDKTGVSLQDKLQDKVQAEQLAAESN